MTVPLVDSDTEPPRGVKRTLWDRSQGRHVEGVNCQIGANVNEMLTLHRHLEIVC